MLIVRTLPSPLSHHNCIVFCVTRNRPATLAFITFFVGVAVNYYTRIATVGPAILGGRINQGSHREAYSLADNDRLPGAKYREHIE